MYQAESNFFNSIKNKCHIIFDVGAYIDSIFTSSNSEVHYFEPYSPYMEELKKIPNNNKKSFFNNFGLSDETSTFDFWINSYSFVKRPHSTGSSVKCNLKRGDDYCKNNNIMEIDFLKIDVECMETKVFKGFGDYLNIVKIIQFEYGPGQKEVGDNLNMMLSYLEQYNFIDFNYMFFEDNEYLTPITDRNDMWRWCNIVAYNKKYFSIAPWKEYFN